jgi:hypothetical protein
VVVFSVVLALGIAVAACGKAVGLGSVVSRPAPAVDGSPTKSATKRPDSTKWPFLGAYTGPGSKGVAGLLAWEDWSGIETRVALDFAPADSWNSISGADWQLSAWAETGRRLIYSVPLFPKSEGDLAGCAAGEYDGHWTTLANNLVGHKLPNTIVRPGWELNGNWYGWSSGGHEADYAACFRHLVDAMRDVPGQHFEFLWNPILGTKFSAAEPAYPGDAYVDYVGADVYDTSWLPNTYPLPADATDARRGAARRAVWSAILDGEKGLRFWARYAARHDKRFAVPEWGLSERTDGRGGGDNAYFVERMLGFLADPATRPTFAMYFEVDASLDDGGLNQHRISLVPSVFPQAAVLFRQVVARGPGPS